MFGTHKTYRNVSTVVKIFGVPWVVFFLNVGGCYGFHSFANLAGVPIWFSAALFTIIHTITLFLTKKDERWDEVLLANWEFMSDQIGEDVTYDV